MRSVLVVVVLLSGCIATNRPTAKSFGQQVSRLRSVDGQHKPFGVLDRMDLSGGHTYKVTSVSGRGQVYTLSAGESELCFATSREARGGDERGEAAKAQRFAEAASYAFRWLDTLDGIASNATFSQPDPNAKFVVKNVGTKWRPFDTCRQDRPEHCKREHGVITIKLEMCTPMPEVSATAGFMALEVLNPFDRNYDEVAIWRLTSSDSE